MMVKCCMTCFALLLTISLTHATGLLGGSGGVAGLGGGFARGNLGLNLIGDSGISGSIIRSADGRSISLTLSLYIRLMYYVSALEKVCYDGILDGRLPRGLFNNLGYGFNGQFGGGIAGGFGGLGLGGSAGAFTGSLGGGISGGFGSGFAGGASGFGSSSLSGSLQGSLNAGLNGRAIGKGAAY